MSNEVTSLRPRDSFRCKQFPMYKRRIVGCFSLDHERRYMATGVNCKYLKKPISVSTRAHFDLNEGYNLVIKKQESASKEKLDHVLTFITQNLHKLTNKNALELPQQERKTLEADIVCFRGLLRLLMCTPYENKDGWSILATRYHGTIYLSAYETAENRHSREAQTDELKKILSYGFKFEQYMLSGA